MLLVATMSRRVVLRDIAEKAGVHLTTAARAMKNDPRVNSNTLAKIQQIAKELGYTPDPMLSALSVYRTTSQPSLYHGTVAWVTNYPTRDGWAVETFRHYRDGATEALARAGYHIEEFWLREPGYSAKRAGQILQSRGIRGLLVCPLPVNYGHLSLQWARFATVTFGYTLVRPAVHLVTASHYYHVQLCLRNLHRLGYRRIGMVTWDSMERRVHQFWTAAYRTQLPSLQTQELPILHLDHAAECFTAGDKKKFLKWVATYKVEAVIAVDRQFLNWLRQDGYRVPDDIAYVSPSLQESNVEHAGVLEPSKDIGRAAGELLVDMLNRGEFGLPRAPRRIMLDGIWQLGKTAKNQRQPAT
jgi:DNA-binding LacI/PurR family transcriptional regulator